MSKRCFVTVLLCVSILSFPLDTFAAGWTQMEKGTVQSLYGLAKVGDVFFGVGNSGKMIRSTDAGVTWSISDQNANVAWQEIETVGQKVYVVGELGTARESTDGGATWKTLSFGVQDHLYDIDTSSERGYIVGSNGRILYYASATNHWISAVSPTTLTLHGVQDMGDGRAWVVGSQGVLLYSVNSGVSWINKGKIVNEDLYGVWFISETTGFAVGKNGTFVKTTNAGISWSQINVNGLSSQMLYDIEGFGNELVVVGDKIILRSSDAGATWSAYDYSSENYTLRDAFVPSASELWVSGTKDDVQSVILKWQIDPSPAPSSVILSEPQASEGSQEAATNSLIKLSCSAGAVVSDPCKAVYFYGSDGKRHAFANDKVFFTWYENFDAVKEVSKIFMSSVALGKNITYHPGTKMVKFQSVKTVYAVSKKGTLRAIGSETVAKELYGVDWNKKIDDISDAFYGNYTFGAKIEKSSDYDVAAEKTSVSSLDDNF